MTDREIVRRVIYIRNHLAEYYDDNGRIDRSRLIVALNRLRDDINRK